MKKKHKLKRKEKRNPILRLRKNSGEGQLFCSENPSNHTLYYRQPLLMTSHVTMNRPNAQQSEQKTAHWPWKMKTDPNSFPEGVLLEVSVNWTSLPTRRLRRYSRHSHAQGWREFKQTRHKSFDVLINTPDLKVVCGQRYVWTCPKSPQKPAGLLCWCPCTCTICSQSQKFLGALPLVSNQTVAWIGSFCVRVDSSSYVRIIGT